MVCTDCCKSASNKILFIPDYIKQSRFKNLGCFFIAINCRFILHIIVLNSFVLVNVIKRAHVAKQMLKQVQHGVTRDQTW
jgi:hypothetical protein